MSGDEDFRIRPGRIRSRGSQRVLPIITQALVAAQRAGGHVSRSGRIIAPGRSTFGRGRVASLRATHRLGHRSRQVVVKARVVKHGGRASLAAHLNYLQRDGVTRDGEKGVLFGAEAEGLDRNAFAATCENDRHHFRFIVSPEDAPQMGDLKTFTRELMTQMEKDLGTRLDWRAVEHWNTDNPHVHIIVRGVGEDGQNLVISRDYIREGMRAVAREIVTRELGLRTDLEIRASLVRQVEAERWTEIDRDLSRTLQREGIIDMAPEPGVRPDGDHALRMGRLRKLEGLGLASEIAPGQWTLADDAQAALREMGNRDDIIKRMHKAMTDRGIDRGAASYVLDLDPAQPVIGKLVDRGLHDELTGRAYAIVDGIDGRTHHVQLPNIEATGDCRPGAIVELRRFEDRKGRQRVALAVRSDMDLDAQVRAPGATWLDRCSSSRAIGRRSRQRRLRDLEVRASDGRARRASRRRGPGAAARASASIFARNLLDTLQASASWTRSARGAVGRDRHCRSRRRPRPASMSRAPVRQRLDARLGPLRDDRRRARASSSCPGRRRSSSQIGQHISGVAARGRRGGLVVRPRAGGWGCERRSAETSGAATPAIFARALRSRLRRSRSAI